MSDPAPAVPVLIVTGPVGVGKTTVASELSELLEGAGVPHALVDLDALRWCYPTRPDDPYSVTLAMRNLAAVWSNFQSEGAKRLVVADVIESREELERYRAAVPGARVTVVRLQASPGTLRGRVRRRELASGLERHLERAVELHDLMEVRKVEDLSVDTDSRSVDEIAREILHRTGWLDDCNGQLD